MRHEEYKTFVQTGTTTLLTELALSDKEHCQSLLPPSVKKDVEILKAKELARSGDYLSFWQLARKTQMGKDQTDLFTAVLNLTSLP